MNTLVFDENDFYRVKGFSKGILFNEPMSTLISESLTGTHSTYWGSVQNIFFFPESFNRRLPIFNIFENYNLIIGDNEYRVKNTNEDFFKGQINVFTSFVKVKKTKQSLGVNLYSLVKGFTFEIIPNYKGCVAVKSKVYFYSIENLNKRNDIIYFNIEFYFNLMREVFLDILYLNTFFNYYETVRMERRTQTLDNIYSQNKKVFDENLKIKNSITNVNLDNVRYVKEDNIPNRHNNPCEYSFDVRGHYRNLQSGKRVWVSAYTKGKGKEKKDSKHKFKFKK